MKKNAIFMVAVGAFVLVVIALIFAFIGNQRDASAPSEEVEVADAPQDAPDDVAQEEAEETVETDAPQSADAAAQPETVEPVETDPRQSAEASPEETPVAMPSAIAGFHFMDSVDIYQKNGLVEIYGGSYLQRRTGPIRISKSILHPSHEEMWVVWSPDITPEIDPQFMLVELAPEFQDAGELGVGFILGNGQVIGWRAELGPAVTDLTPAADAAHIREDFAAAVSELAWQEMETLGRGVFRVEIPAEVKAYFDEEKRWAIESWFVRIAANGGAPVPFVKLSLGSPRPHADAATSDLSGRIYGSRDAIDRTVTLLMENGERRRQAASSDGRFRFRNVPVGMPVSVRLPYREMDAYATRGRWFQPEPGTTDVTIDLELAFREGPRAPSWRAFPDEIVDVKGDSPSDVLSYHRYTPHTRQLLNGAAGIQVTFANNHGFPDRDREFENKDNCVRILRAGSSIEMAIQVRPFEKYSILMEGELGVRLGRCVEIIPMGKDAGDIGANFRVIRDYGMKFDPDVISLEKAFNTIFNLHPVLIRAHRGWDFDHNGHDHFRYEPDGTLVFRTLDPNWPLHTVERESRPDLDPPLPEGHTYVETVWLPFEHLHPVGVSTFGYLRDILKYYQDTYPDVDFALHSGLEQAQCFSDPEYCTQKITLDSGVSVDQNFIALIDNFSWSCQQAGVDCIHPTFPDSTSEEHYLLPHDGHFTARGHQWMVRETIDQLESLVRGAL